MTNIFTEKNETNKSVWAQVKYERKTYKQTGEKSPLRLAILHVLYTDFAIWKKHKYLMALTRSPPDFLPEEIFWIDDYTLHSLIWTSYDFSSVKYIYYSTRVAFSLHLFNDVWMHILHLDWIYLPFKIPFFFFLKTVERFCSGFLLLLFFLQKANGLYTSTNIWN